MRSVKQAAIRDLCGKIWTLPRPARHHDIIHVMFEKTMLAVPLEENEQGFLLDDGQFIGREYAALLVRKNGQIKPDHELFSAPYSRELYSEDLW